MFQVSGQEKNPKLGFYTVGEEIFYSKPAALIHATKTGHYPTWHFNTEIYAKLSWDRDPEINLKELYRLRAQQLRDQYDYIRLEASGGSDSTTVIYSFLLNNINLDEIVYRYPAQLDTGVTNDPFNTKAENTLSERQFAADPLLNWVKTNYPRTKVTFQDYGETLLTSNYMKDESWITHTREYLQPGHGIKYSHFNTREHKLLADSGKKICSLHGVDKPRMALLENNWYGFFGDVQANSPCPVRGDHDNIISELFYWTPDFPEISIKQAHMIATWFDMPQNSHLKYLLQWPNRGFARRTAVEQLMKSIIYPDYDHETWQTSKPTNNFYNEMDHWFHVNLKDTAVYRTWQAGVQYLIDKIDSKYLTYEYNKPTGFVGFVTPLYFLKASTVDNNQPAFVNQSYKQETGATGEILAVVNKKLKKIQF